MALWLESNEARFCQGPRSDPRPGSTRLLLALPGCPLSGLQAAGDVISADAAGFQHALRVLTVACGHTGQERIAY
jgi:hypothetical protein